MRYADQPSILEEIKEIRRFFKIPKNEREIVFYTEHGGYWPAFEGLINELNNNHGRTVFYITSGWSDPALNFEKPRIKSFYINKLMPLFAQLIDSKVFIMTLSDLNNHYIKRSRYSVHYVYVFHALVSTHMVYNFGAFNHYDSIFCVGPHHIKEIKKHEELYNLKPKKLVGAGYHRLERIIDEFKEYNDSSVGKDKKTILIAPSWGDQNILETCGCELTRLLLDKGYNVIVRPHSETLKRSPGLTKKIEEEFSLQSNFSLEKSNALDESILAADILISDSSGIAIEYAFGTERPVIFIDVPLKIKNKRYREINLEPLELFLRPRIGKIVAPKNLESLPSVIEDLLANIDKYRAEIRRLRDQYVFNLGNSSKVEADYILRLL